MDLVKLGGSVITDKSRLRTFRRSACDRVARELRSSPDGLVLVHGAGSFGHIEARRHGLHKGYERESQLAHVAAVQRDVRELDLKVLKALIDAGLRAVSVPPAAAAPFRNGKISSFDPDPFERVLGLGLVPVSFGDVVPDGAMGFSICSGDLMMQALAERFRPRMAVFVADVDGVFDADPRKDRRARLIPEITASSLSGLRRSKARTPDVTGSIFGKLERMLAIAEHCEKCMIVNGNVPGRLEKALRGRQVVSTVVVPG